MVGSRALGIDDDPGLVIDEIVGIVSGEWGRPPAWRPTPPADRLARLPSEACVYCRHHSTRHCLDRHLPHRSWWYLKPLDTHEPHGMPPRHAAGNWLIAGRPFLLVHISLDQAGVDRKSFAANQPDADALRHHTFKNPP